MMPASEYSPEQGDEVKVCTKIRRGLKTNHDIDRIARSGALSIS